MESSEQKKTAGPTPAAIDSTKEACRALYFRLTVFFSSAPGVNFATRRAAILMVAPVCGLRPFRAFLCDTEKVPKPIKATRSPFFNAPVMLLTAVSIAVVAAALLISQAPAILSTRSALFIVCFSSQVSLSCIPSAHREETSLVSELGNLMADILLSLRRMSTVKIRAGSLFCTTVSRIGAGGAGFGLADHVENVAGR